MMEKFLSKLQGATGVTLFPPFDVQKRRDPMKLPKAHSEILNRSNGLAVYGGYFRLWGVEETSSLSIEKWNESQYWKFAWNGRADDFLCFGSTAWGDQYAYHIRSLAAEKNAEVFLLDAITMEAEILSPNFEVFWHDEFVRNAFHPYDYMVVENRNTVGRLKFDELLAFDPPLQLGGTEDTAICAKLNARAVMVANGDLTTELDSLPDNAQILGARSYVDDLGRSRVKLVTQA
jgi:hypothetical protein